MRGLVPGFLLLMLSGCISFGGCGPTPTAVEWSDPEFAADIRAAQQEDWNVFTQPRPHGLPVEHPWLERWNAAIRSVSLHEMMQTEDEGYGHSGRMEANVHLQDPARVSVHLPADQDPVVVRPTVLRFLEALTDGNESERDSWADQMLAEPDLPEGVSYPPPEHRHYTLIPYEVGLPPQRLRVQAFVDEHFDPDGPADHIRSGDWSFSVEYATTVATRGGQAFRASPERNEFQDTAWGEDYGNDRALEDFRQAYDSLDVGPVPEDADVGTVVC